MLKKKIWIPILIVLLAVIGYGLFHRQKTADQEPITIIKPVEIERPTAKPRSPKPTEPDTSVLQRPTSGHFHEDGTFHAESHEPAAPATVVEPLATVEVGGYGVGGELIAAETISPEDDIFVWFRPPAGVGPDWVSMSPETLARFIKEIEENRIDAPEGYDYKRRSDDWTSLLLDRNGYPVLHKRGEPFISISWGIGFRPTPEQYAEYKALLKRYKEAGLSSSPEEDKLGEQLLEMRRTYVGSVPGVGYSFAVPGDTDMKAYHRKYDSITMQLRREAYRKAGLGYMKE